MSKHSDEGVFSLLTDLCRNTASKWCSNRSVSQPRLVSKMRSLCYEHILKKSATHTAPPSNPINDLLAFYLSSSLNIKNVAEYKRSIELKELISKLKQKGCGDAEKNICGILQLLASLSDSIEDDVSVELYQKPFSFGLQDQMQPRPPIELFGSPDPYAFFPSTVFELPYSLKQQPIFGDNTISYSDYNVESFHSKSCLSTGFSQDAKSSDLNSLMSPMVLEPLSSTHTSKYANRDVFNLPRLSQPRDLQIPHMMESSCSQKVSLASTNHPKDLKEVYKAETKCSVDIWELASHVDNDLPSDIWEIVAKMPDIQERQLICMCDRQIGIWRNVYQDMMCELSVVSEKKFIRDIMYLIIGIETTSFPFSKEMNCFYVRETLILEGVSKEHLHRYTGEFLLVGTYYKRLHDFAFAYDCEQELCDNGLVFEAAKECVRRYLLKFRIAVTKIFEGCFQENMERYNCLPTLLEILDHVEPLKNELEIFASIYYVVELEPQSGMPVGTKLMSYLYNEISMITHTRSSVTLCNALLYICQVYFKFIERYIFEGELDDAKEEFFIKKDPNFVNCPTKKYWDKSFRLVDAAAIPEFLKSLANRILLCGKSLRLLKLCNPGDPLVLLLSTNHPKLKCCSNFSQLEHQEKLLDVYRTRCLFVSGEPITFEQILLKKEAERKAFVEMAAVKQAETIEKIVAERKRLAQLILAEKQHSYKVLEAAMAEAKAAKNKVKEREKRRSQLEEDLTKATEEVDAILRDDERNKIMDYYSKLNMEVEKSKLHTEWKIKRLQLDKSRIQLISTEERNLKQEKLELEHKNNEDIMSMSFKSDGDFDTESQNIEVTEFETASEDAESRTDLQENQFKSQNSGNVFNAICNAALNFFGSAKTEDVDDNLDNNKGLDSQGNIVTTIQEVNSNFDSKTSVQDEDIATLKSDSDFLSARSEAISNRDKVLYHDFTKPDNENNVISIPQINLELIDTDNNRNLTTFEAAKRNRMRVLGEEYYDPNNEENTLSNRKGSQKQAFTEAQKEALVNRSKVLGVEYNLPAESITIVEPLNIAQEEAIRNRRKATESDLSSTESLSRVGSARSRLGLTLNLKPCVEFAENEVIPFTPLSTPAEYIPRLDLETPTTADVQLEDQISNEFLSGSRNDDSASTKKTEKQYMPREGFDFSIIIDEDTTDHETGDINLDSEYSPKYMTPKSNRSKLNIIDGTYDLEDFDPFNIKSLTKYATGFLTYRMEAETSPFSYTNAGTIMEEVQKKPYKNIFWSTLDLNEDEPKVTYDNIATLTACLQKSVMLPLTYQLEVVNHSMLTYFLVNLDMYEHMRSLKDYFFLMDGEFCRSICNHLFQQLVKTINPEELLNFSTLHNILDKALGSSISRVPKFSENLSFTITEPPLSFQHSSPDVLQCLSLTYIVDWPMNIILSQEALSRYGKVFQFLIKLRRVSWVLAQDFEKLKLEVKLAKSDARKLLRSPQYMSIQLYRHIMASMIRALDNYIVTTCILTSWTEYENDLKKARTLDDLYECHVVYIKKVLFRCLLNNRSMPVMKLLNDIFTVILKFSRVLKAGNWYQKEPTSPFTHTHYIQLEEIFHLFEKLGKYLHKVVTRLMECGYQRHLVELLTLINLNGYYDPDSSRGDQSARTPK